MSIAKRWQEIILDSTSETVAWKAIFKYLQEIASETSSPVELHKKTIPADRLLSECAWNLWSTYNTSAEKTSELLIERAKDTPAYGRAILVIDALSLNEMLILLGGANKHGVTPIDVRVTGAEIPTDTDSFAQALGVNSRSALQDNTAPKNFRVFKEPFYTDVLHQSFADCSSALPHERNLFIWHTWLDEMIHISRRTPDQIHTSAVNELQSDGFWNFVNCMRQGRRLIITGDHGYAQARLFSNEETDAKNIEAFRSTFRASRYIPSTEPWTHAFMPPGVLTTDTHHVIIGQKKWTVQGGFPQLCHGGLTLLEAAVPFIEFEAI